MGATWGGMGLISSKNDPWGRRLLRINAFERGFGAHAKEVCELIQIPCFPVFRRVNKKTQIKKKKQGARRALRACSAPRAAAAAAATACLSAAAAAAADLQRQTDRQRDRQTETHDLKTKNNWVE